MLDFGVSGKLINNALVMYDRETRSLWSQFLSEAVAGEFKGTELDIVPTALTTWGQWKKTHPESVALRKPANVSDPYNGYYLGDQAGVIGEKNQDDRLSRKELVLGTGFDGEPKAFPHSELRRKRVTHDTLDGVPALIYFDPQSDSAMAYDRTVDGRSLRFQVAEQDGREWLVDDETGTRWVPFTGQAIEGPLAGNSLERIHAVNVFWFAWTDFFPETELYGA